MAKRSAPAEVEQEEKIEKAAPPKAEKAPKEPKEPGKVTEKQLKWKASSKSFGKDFVITLLVDYNPKRVGTKTHERFEKYEDEMTVEAALTAGITMDDLAWAVHQKEIKIDEEFDEDAEKRSRPEPKPKKEKVAKAPGEGKAPARAAKAQAKPAPDEDEDEDEEEAAPAPVKRSAKK